jgi:hypothetical protein
MERELEKIVKQYKQIGLSEKGEPYDRPCKHVGIDENGFPYNRYSKCPVPPKTLRDYGYATNGIHTDRPVWAQNMQKRCEPTTTGRTSNG